MIDYYMPTMTDIHVNGLSVHLHEAGDGPPVVLLHSSSGSGGQWRGLMESLAGSFRLFAPDLLGYGKSDPLPVDRGTTDLDEELALIAAVIERAGPPVHLIGHSYGGYLATTAAVRQPGAIASLTLIEPVLFHLLREAGETAAYEEIRGVAEHATALTLAGRHGDAAGAFLDYWIAPGALGAMPDSLQAAVIGTMDKIRHEWPFGLDLELPPLAGIAALDMPVHILCADRTTLAAATVVKLLRTALPDAAFNAIEGAGHMSPVTHPEKVNPLLEEFLDDQPR